jgi:hypothetical protein
MSNPVERMALVPRTAEVSVVSPNGLVDIDFATDPDLAYPKWIGVMMYRHDAVTLVADLIAVLDHDEIIDLSHELEDKLTTAQRRELAVRLVSSL